MSWTASGELWGHSMTLVWDDATGSSRWPGAVRRMIAEPVFSGTHVRLTATGPSIPLDVDEPVSVAAWLHQRGLTLSGDLPLGPIPVPHNSES